REDSDFPLVTRHQECFSTNIPSLCGGDDARKRTTAALPSTSEEDSRRLLVVSPEHRGGRRDPSIRWYSARLYRGIARRLHDAGPRIAWGVTSTRPQRPPLPAGPAS